MMNCQAVARQGRLLGGLALAATLGACGGGGTTNPPPVTQPPVPAVAITSRGAGLLVIHPSADSRFFFAFETPIRITETAGGTADWNFARMQMFRKGAEIERFELGADVIDRAGFKRVTANSNKVYTILFRTNQDDFDDIVLTLGFSDLKDGRQFTATVEGATFDGVDISIIPMSLPNHRITIQD